MRIAHGLYELYDTGAAHSEGAPSRSNRRERREARAGLVNARVEAGIGDFTKHLGIYDGQYPFRRSGQWSNHVETIRIRRERGTVEEAIQDDAFVATLHETLRSWGIGKRASRLAPLNVFAEILRQHTDELQDLDGMTIEYANADAEEILDRLWTFISTAEVVDNRAKVVAGTKTLHHLLPDLVPPMDREWTGRFFEWSLNDFQTRQREIFEEGYRSFVEIARQVQPSQYVGEDGERRQASSSTTRSSAT